jgi:hypothetical protein
MNCELCQELIGDLIDGTLSRENEAQLNLHLQECLDCDEVRRDLESIVAFCRNHRGEYNAPPNPNALWLRIRNVVEAENQPHVVHSSTQPARSKSWRDWFTRRWEVSLPQLAGSVAAIVLVVSVVTAVGVRQWEGSSDSRTTAVLDTSTATVRDRLWQQRQAIGYWNQRVEVNKARWSQEMRDTFDRNLKVIDQAVNDSLAELNKNPHDEVSEEMLNAALNEKLALLREFSDL